MPLSVGDTFQHPFSKAPNWRPKCHFLAMVDDDFVVFKWYGRTKQWWHYEVEHISMLQLDKKER